MNSFLSRRMAAPSDENNAKIVRRHETFIRYNLRLLQMLFVYWQFRVQ